MTARGRSPGPLVEWSEHAGEVHARFEADMELTISSPREGVCRMRWAPSGQPAPARSWSTLPTFEDGSALPVCVNQTASGDLVIDCGGVSVQLDKGGNAHVVGQTGEAIFDDRGGGVRWESGAFEWRIHMPRGSTYYGCGERTGLLERGGRRYTSWVTDRFEGQSPSTDEMYVAVPLCVALDASGHCSALFVNTTWRSALDLTALESEMCAIEAEGPQLEVVLIDGPQPAVVMERFSALVGRPLLPPRWSLGYIQSRWSYPSESCVRELADEFRSRRIPIDAIVLDIDHMDGHRSFMWDQARFADPKRLVDDLNGMGIHVVAVSDCGVKVDLPGRNPVYDAGSSAGYFLRTTDGQEFTGFVWPGVSVLPDFTREEVRRWWGRLHEVYVAARLDGVLTDMNEPSLRDRPL